MEVAEAEPHSREEAREDIPEEVLVSRVMDALIRHQTGRIAKANPVTRTLSILAVAKVQLDCLMKIAWESLLQKLAAYVAEVKYWATAPPFQ